MGYQKYIQKLWKKPSKEITKSKLIAWRKEPSTVRLSHPTRIDRARTLGYRAKQGIFIIRQRVKRGGHTRPKIKKGRRSKNTGTKLNLSKSYRLIAEQRVQKKYPNCEVLNSYFVLKDGKHVWYEVILVEKANTAIMSDKILNWVVENQHNGRVWRGKTSAGRKSRGLQ